MISRRSNNQIATDLPLRESLEVCWRAFKKYGLENCVIDMERREVQGENPRSLLSYGKIITARVEDNLEARLISLSIKDVNLGNTDLGGNKRILKRLSETIIAELAVAPSESLETRHSKNSPAPIPSPHGGPIPPLNNPIYGSVEPAQHTQPKLGVIVLLCGILGLLNIVFALAAIGCGGLVIKGFYDDPSQEKRVTFDTVMVAVGTLLGTLGMWISLAYR